jgi:hypothetical protein
VAQDVRCYLPFKACGPDGCAERLAHRTHRLAVPLDDHLLGDAEPLPTPHMREQAVGDTNRRLPFLRFPGAHGAAVEHATIEIDVPAPDRRHERRAADRSVSRTTAEPDQNEPGEVATYRAPRALVSHDLLGPPCRP